MKSSDLLSVQRKITKITTVYDQFEDRMRLDSSLTDGSFVCLFLTRSILNRLIPHLQNGLARASGGAQGRNFQSREHGPDQFAEQFIQKVVQKSAVESLSKDNPPVAVVPTTTRHLIRSINLKWVEGQAVLELISAPPIEISFGLSLGDVEARQWLAIIKGRYVAAGWMENFWADRI